MTTWASGSPAISMERSKTNQISVLALAGIAMALLVVRAVASRSAISVEPSKGSAATGPSPLRPDPPSPLSRQNSAPSERIRADQEIDFPTDI
ncbi:MAG: hypothetical protein ACI82F_001774 [Planctomycetota bacterium]|jgi:hypothetical protein